MNKHCLDEFRAHWQCLDNNNHQLWQCRAKEWSLNKCVFHNLVRTSSLSASVHNVQAQADRPGRHQQKLEKTIPDAAGVPIHLRQKQIFAHAPIIYKPDVKYLDLEGKKPEAPATNPSA